MSAVNTFKISKATINFKIAIVQFVSMYPTIDKSETSFHYLKNYLRIMKGLCQENPSEFK